MQNLIKFQSFVHKILNGNEISILIKGHNGVVNLRNLTINKPNIELVKVNAYAKFEQISSICSRVFELKHNYDNNQGT